MPPLLFYYAEVLKMKNKSIWLLSLLALIAPFSASATEREVPASRADVMYSYAPVVEKTAPAVVNIYTKRKVQTALGAFSPFFDDPLFGMLFGDQLSGIPRERVESSLGSGVIVRQDGLVVTNNHVIKGAQQIKVVLNDRREFDAKVVLTDEKSDLAFLKVDVGGTPLPAIEIGDSDTAKVGDIVLAIGNPFGVGQTVTSGIVSAIARTNVPISGYHYFIQTDAAINPGNSGGALVGLDGKLMGINSAIYSKSGGSLGIGFAIPVNMVKVAMQSAESGRSQVARPWFGAEVQDISSEMAESLGFAKPSGVIVKDVYKDSPAEKAGVKVGDIILALDANEVSDSQEMYYRLATKQIGATCQLKVYRGGEKVDLTLKTESPPENPPRDLRDIAGRNPLMGVKVANLSPALATELGMDVAAKGVVIIGISAKSPAPQFGFAKGDIILQVNDVKVQSTKELESIMQKKARGWDIIFQRGGAKYTVTVGE